MEVKEEMGLPSLLDRDFCQVDHVPESASQWRRCQ